MSFIQSQYDPKKHTLFQPTNLKKFIGKRPPVCRSSWEFKFCRWLDRNNQVKKWASEPIEIPYVDPTKIAISGTKPHTRRYYPDFYVEFENGDKYLIEIKPNKETKPPRKGKKKAKSTLINEEKTWRVNAAKWKAAQVYCRKRGWGFKILTEKQLFGK